MSRLGALFGLGLFGLGFGFSVMVSGFGFSTVGWCLNRFRVTKVRV